MSYTLIELFREFLKEHTVLNTRKCILRRHMIETTTINGRTHYCWKCWVKYNEAIE